MARNLPLVVFLILTCSVSFAADERGALPLTLYQAPSDTSEENLMNPNHPAWARASEQTLRFHRTPPLYADGPFDDGARPEASVRIVQRQTGEVYLKLQWSDSSEDLFERGARYPNSGETHIYKAQTSNTDAFGDAACVMTPTTRAPIDSYPSMMMGDAANPVDLLFWQAGRGFSLLNAHGRASTAATKTELKGKSIRTAQGWEVIFVLTDSVDSLPLCFAIWQGNKQHRDGLKYYSLWYELKR